MVVERLADADACIGCALGGGGRASPWRLAAVRVYRRRAGGHAVAGGSGSWWSRLARQEESAAAHRAASAPQLNRGGLAGGGAQPVLGCGAGGCGNGAGCGGAERWPGCWGGCGAGSRLSKVGSGMGPVGAPGAPPGGKLRRSWRHLFRFNPLRPACQIARRAALWGRQRPRRWPADFLRQPLFCSPRPVMRRSATRARALARSSLVSGALGSAVSVGCAGCGSGVGNGGLAVASSIGAGASVGSAGAAGCSGVFFDVWRMASIAASKVRAVARKSPAALVRPSPIIAASTMAPSISVRRPARAATEAAFRILRSSSEMAAVPPSPGGRRGPCGRSAGRHRFAGRRC